MFYFFFFFSSHSLPLFLSWFLISAFMGKGVGFIFLISSPWLGLSIYLFFLFWFFLSLTFFVNVCVNVSYHIIFFFFYYRVKINTHIFCRLFWPISFFYCTTFRLQVFKCYYFFFTWESVNKIYEKCGTIGVHFKWSSRQ